MTPTISLVLSWLTLLAQVSIAILFLFTAFSLERVGAFATRNLGGRKAIRAAFVVALVATAGSLYYSEIAGFVPCDLCWFQRIFMYPQVVLLGLALWKRDDRIVDYALALAGIGFLFSLYHNIIIATATQSAFCSFTSVSCTTKTVMGLGYVTIPLMALTAFASIISVLLLGKHGGKADR